jgi:hypothetical protein
LIALDQVLSDDSIAVQQDDAIFVSLNLVVFNNKLFFALNHKDSF